MRSLNLGQVIALVPLVAVLSGCSLLGGDPASSAPPIVVPSATAGSSEPAPVPSFSVDLPDPPTPDQSSPAQPSPSPTRTTGQRPIEKQSAIRGRQGDLSWDIQIPAFTQHPAAPATNRRIVAAATGMIDRAKREARDDAGAKRTLTGHGRVSTNDGRTAQVVITYEDNLEGTAHPAYYVTTTVVDVKSIKPVLLEQVIQNPPEGLRFLRTQVLKIAKKKGHDLDGTGLEPKLGNYANWQSTTKGLEFHFNDYQLGPHGLLVYTVPWKSARLVLSAQGEKLLLP